MATEKDYHSQLLQQRIISKKLKQKKARPSKITTKQPLSSLLAPLGLAFGFEVVTFGIAPGWTLQVIYTYRQENKIKGSANIAEYTLVGILTVTIDGIQLLGMSGALAFFTLALTAPALLLLSAWRLYKRTKLGF